MSLMLEAFDRDDSSPIVNPEKSSDYLRGFQEGLAAGERNVQDAQTALNAELVQSISDCLFSFDEARLHVVENLAPLIDMTVKRLLPSTLTQGLCGLLHDIILQAAADDATKPATIHLHPAQIAKVAESLAGIDHPHLRFIPEPTCSENAATVATPTGETALDLDHALSQISEIFSALPTQIQRTASHD